MNLFSFNSSATQTLIMEIASLDAKRRW